MPIDIYDQDVMFHVGDIDELCDTMADKAISLDIIAELRRRLNKDYPKAATVMIDGGPIIVYIPEDRPKYIVSELAHEVFHVVCRIAERVGITLTNGSEECYAYLQAYLFNTALNRLGLTFSSDASPSRLSRGASSHSPSTQNGQCGRHDEQ